MTDKKIPPIAPHSDRLLELLKIETHKELEIEKKERAVYQKVINHKMEMMSGIIQERMMNSFCGIVKERMKVIARDETPHRAWNGKINTCNYVLRPIPYQGSDDDEEENWGTLIYDKAPMFLFPLSASKEWVSRMIKTFEDKVVAGGFQLNDFGRDLNVGNYTVTWE